MSNSLVGQRFGKLVPTGVSSSSTKGESYDCLCDCGKSRVIRRVYLLRGSSKSCGCGRYPKRVSDATKKISIMWANYRDKAKRRSLAWMLTKFEFGLLVTGRCHYCGVKTLGGFVGVDRMDSSKGYETANCVSACSQCNFAKSDTPYQEFKDWIERVYGHLFHE